MEGLRHRSGVHCRRVVGVGAVAVEVRADLGEGGERAGDVLGLLGGGGRRAA